MARWSTRTEEEKMAQNKADGILEETVERVIFEMTSALDRYRKGEITARELRDFCSMQAFMRLTEPEVEAELGPPPPQDGGEDPS